jgi:hypothetical protein
MFLPLFVCLFIQFHSSNYVYQSICFLFHLIFLLVGLHTALASSFVAILCFVDKYHALFIFLLDQVDTVS